jgi:hypothetical protein
VSTDSKVPTARAVAHGLTPRCKKFWLLGQHIAHTSLCDRLTAAIERDRTATIEACAREVEAITSPGEEDGRAARIRQYVAARIRALDTRKAP